MSFAQKERERLAQLLLELGPDAPTLNDGWQTKDLAVHLLIRERKPLAAAGIVLPVAQSLLHREEQQQHARSYEDVVREWSAGPPAFIAPINTAMNTAEHFIHHEDVRRGGGVVEPREFSREVDRQLMQLVKRFGRLVLRKSPIPIVLTPPTLPPVTVGGQAGVAERGDNVARVFGSPGELLLWVSGRDAVDITLGGNSEALTGFKRAM